MIQFQTSQFKKLKEVQGDQLDELEGWTLVATYQEQKEGGVVTKHLLGKDETTVISDLQAQVATLEGDPGSVGNLQAQLAREQSDRQAAANSATALQTQVTTLEAQVVDLESQVSDRDDTITGLNSDIQKLRDHFGDAEVTAVLNA